MHTVGENLKQNGNLTPVISAAAKGPPSFLYVNSCAHAVLQAERLEVCHVGRFGKVTSIPTLVMIGMIGHTIVAKSRKAVKEAA